MLITEHSDPQHVVVESFTLHTNRGPVTFFETESIALNVDKLGNLCVGTGGTVFLIKSKTALNDILSKVRPVASFDLAVEEDGEMSLVASLRETPSAMRILETIPYVDKTFSEAADVNSIRPYKE